MLTSLLSKHVFFLGIVWPHSSRSHSSAVILAVSLLKANVPKSSLLKRRSGQEFYVFSHKHLEGADRLLFYSIVSVQKAGSSFNLLNGAGKVA